MKKKKGSALILMLGVTMLLLVMSTSILQIAVTSFKTSKSYDNINKVNLMAESGIEKALAQVKQKSDIVSSIEDFTSEDGQIKTSVKFKDNMIFNYSSNAYQSDSSKCTVESTSTDGKYFKVIRVVLKKTVTSSISKVDTAIFAISSLYLNGSANIIGDVGTNSKEAGTIDYSNNDMFSGTVYIPQGGDPSTIVTGPGWASRPAIKFLDSIKSYPTPVLPAFPEGLPEKNDIDLKGNSSMTIDTNSYYDTISIKSNTTLTINTIPGENIIRVKTLNVQQGNIVLNGTGKLKIYVDDYIDVGGSSTINKNGNVKNLEIYSNNKNKFDIQGNVLINGSLYLGPADIQIAGSGTINGDIITSSSNITISGSSDAGPKLIYAPNADIIINGSGNVKSAVVGNKVKLSGAAKIDISNISGILPIEVDLPAASSNTDITSYTIESWK